MKLTGSSLVSVLSLIASTADAFPSLVPGSQQDDAILSQWRKLQVELSGNGTISTGPHARLAQDPLNTPIQVDGKHRFIPPDFSKGDQRGPCPGLNSLANHGYISRDGVTSLAEVVPAINHVFGMGADLAIVLATIGVVFTGNPLSLNPGLSIGGTATTGSSTDNILGNLLGLLGKPRGLVGSHNIIEADSSNTRNDFSVTGDASTLDMDLFQSFINMLPEDGDFDIDVMARRAETRFHESVATNPQFYFGPLTGAVLRNAAFAFATRFFSNHSAGNPGGVLSKSCHAYQYKCCGIKKLEHPTNHAAPCIQPGRRPCRSSVSPSRTAAR